MNIKDFKNGFELTLHKPNRDIISILTMFADGVSVSKKIDDIDSLTFNVNREYVDRFTHNNTINECFYDIKEERLICLNNKEYYVIKNISENDSDTNVKTVSCLSLEHKLTRINVLLEDVGLTLFEEDVEDGILSLEKLIENETGWKIGHVDDSIRYEIVDGETKPRVRWQESVSTSWYSFLTEDICESFICLIRFDTMNKELNIYNINTYGENIGIYLSKDNYIKSIEKQTSTNDIVTRLRLTGKDEVDIRSVNPFGTDYVEDYSYFISNGDMSDDLIEALNSHTTIVENNHDKWTELFNEKLILDKNLISNRSKLYVVCEEIKVLTNLRENYLSLNDQVNADIIDKQIVEKSIEKNKVEQEVRNIESRLSIINSQILIINNQLDRRIALDDDGNKIFNKRLLDELNEFLYYDSYVNNSFITPDSLLDGGKVELSKRCIPTVEYNLDVQDFISRIINHKGRDFNGDLNLGDIIIFYDDILKYEYSLYFVGYDYEPLGNSLTIYISNKKSKINNTKRIADKLRDISNIGRYIGSKKYILNQLKYNKI